MKKLALCIAVIAMLGAAAAEARAVRVKGYFRKDGTYVAPHVRSAPNASRLDNYSTKGNVNPYTGKTGTVDPYPTWPGTPIYVPPAPTYSAPTPRVVQSATTDGQDRRWFPGTSSIRDAELIPWGFQGQWGDSAGACSAQEPTGLMTIYADGIDTYESGGRLRRITQAGQDRSVVMRLDFEGEGTFWEQTYQFTLSPDYRSVRVIDTKDAKSDFTYTRC